MSKLEDYEVQKALGMAADTVTALVREGFSANSAKKFVETGEISVLRHTGKVSVQLFDPKNPNGLR